MSRDTEKSRAYDFSRGEEGGICRRNMIGKLPEERKEIKI